MSVLVEVTEDGLGKLYFRVSEINGEMYVERPDKASIHAPELADAEDITETVITALEAIQREDDKWARIQNETGVKYPHLGNLDI